MSGTIKCAFLYTPYLVVKQFQLSQIWSFWEGRIADAREPVTCQRSREENIFRHLIEDYIS